MKLHLRVAPIIGLAVFLLVWEGFVRLFDVRSFILRSPSAIIRYLGRAPDDFLRASAITAWHAVTGLVLALLVALVLGAAMAASPFLERASQPVLVLLQVTPFVAYISSVVVWLGAGDPPVLFITTLVCTPAFTFAVVAGMRGADPATREILASVNASRWEVLWRLRLPSSMPSILTTARYNIGLALIAAYLVEGSNFANEGLGSIGRAAAAFNQGDPLWATILCMAVLGSIGLLVVAAIERWLIHWHASQRSTRGTEPARRAHRT